MDLITSSLDRGVVLFQKFDWIGSNSDLVNFNDLPLIPIESLSSSLGMETMVIKFMVGMYLCYPLGLIMRLIPANALKHLFNCLIGIFMLQWIFDSTWV